ncbi:methyltransferase domain-containing protein [Pseudonocardia xinjiangensis]|uniref:Methyltransferase domain-containing protein n=1 Tax=Pseudonocardia xinjiangensis TaxID=75289 RepID=A0ABX1R880_9PSEU|nr:methyltransferase domain-containing protein [Pseudonocardia xinjiangensis]NMH76578.1 methyltransferase domain-containing protein [Pseudonocardia xinjiangensis]
MSAAARESLPASFSDIDRSSEELKGHVIEYLSGTASNPEIRRMRATAFQLFAATEGERLLDAGCGLGEVARHLGSVVGPRGSVVALDHSADVISAAHARHDGGPVTYVVGDVTALDFPDDHFDGVRSERVLQHLADPAAAIAELVRVTRPGGRVCVIDTDWPSLTHDGFAHLDDPSVRSSSLLGSTAGRIARSLMVKAGLRGVTASPVTVCFTSPSDAATVLPFFDPQQAKAVDFIPDPLLKSFFDSVDRAAERGDFLVAFTMWVSLGRKGEEGG